MIKLDNLSYFKLLESTGLELNAETGGTLKELTEESSALHKVNSKFYLLKKRKQDDSILFLDGKSFLDTFKETEKAIKLKLFN
jgi:hypothetical protein